MTKSDQKATKMNLKATKPEAAVRSKKSEVAAEKGGRKADGTFAKGNKPKITENYGRPSEDMSFRAQVKIRAAKNPKMVQDAISTLVKIANDPEHPKCIEAIDKLIKLNGNYDPQETKDVTPVKQPPSPLFELTVDELRKLKVLKRGKK